RGCELVVEHLVDARPRARRAVVGGVRVAAHLGEPLARAGAGDAVRWTAEIAIVIVAAALDDGPREILARHRHSSSETIEIRSTRTTGARSSAASEPHVLRIE